MTTDQTFAMTIGFIVFFAVSALWTYQRYKTRKLQQEREWRGY